MLLRRATLPLLALATIIAIALSGCKKEQNNLESPTAKFDQTALTLKVGDTYTATYTKTPNTPDVGISFESDDEEVATVDPLTGEIKAIESGVANIFIYTSYGPGASEPADMLQVTVGDGKKLRTLTYKHADNDFKKHLTDNMKVDKGRIDGANVNFKVVDKDGSEIPTDTKVNCYQKYFLTPETSTEAIIHDVYLVTYDKEGKIETAKKLAVDKDGKFPIQLAKDATVFVVSTKLYDVSYTTATDGELKVSYKDSDFEAGKSEKVAYGEKVRIYAKPNDNKGLVAIEVNGKALTSNDYSIPVEEGKPIPDSYDIIVKGSTAVIARFGGMLVKAAMTGTGATYVVEKGKGSGNDFKGEKINTDGTVAIVKDDVIRVTVTPEEEDFDGKKRPTYYIAALKLNGADFENGGTYTVSNAPVDIQITVKKIYRIKFEPKPIDNAKKPLGTISVSRQKPDAPTTYEPLAPEDQIFENDILQISFKDNDGKDAKFTVNGTAHDPLKLFKIPANTDVTVMADGAVPAPKQFNVKAATPTNGTFEVYNGTTKLTLPTKVDKDTELTIKVTADANYEVDKVMAGTQALTANAAGDYVFKVTADTEINVTFKEKAAAPAALTVTIPKVENATLTVTKGGAALKDQDEVKTGDALVITLTPNKGFKQKTLTVNNKPFTSGETFTVTDANVVIAAEVEADPPAPGA